MGCTDHADADLPLRARTLPELPGAAGQGAGTVGCSAAQVRGPTTPSTTSREAAWNARTAASVLGPNGPRPAV